MVKVMEKTLTNNLKLLKLFFKVLSQAGYGSINVIFQGKTIFKKKSIKNGPNAEIIIKDLECAVITTAQRVTGAQFTSSTN